MEDNQRTAGEELVDLLLGKRDTVLVECGVDQVHRHAIVEEVGDPEDEIVVQDVEPLLHDVPGALTVDKKADTAGEDCESARGDLVADIMNSICGNFELLAVELPGLARPEKYLSTETYKRKENDACEKLDYSDHNSWFVKQWVEHFVLFQLKIRNI